MRALKQVFTVKCGELLLMQSKAVLPLEDVGAGTEVFVFTIPYLWYKQYGIGELSISPQVYKQGDELYLLVIELYNEFLLNTPEALIQMDIILRKILLLLHRGQHNNATVFAWKAKFEAMKGKPGKKINSAAALAKYLGIEHRRFLKEFRQAYGCTPKGFENMEKLEEAARLLRADKNATAKYISDLLGFSDPGTFCRDFKNRFKTTPARYQQDTS
jgi:AraC-like DNA-binding protein